MTAPPNPSRLARRALGEIKNAASIKDDAKFGAKVRAILAEHETRHALMLAEIVKADAEARRLKTGAAPAKQQAAE